MEVLTDHRIFISYARKDATFALQLANDLKSQGYKAWIDQVDIPPGARWDDEIKIALTESFSLIVVLSSSSVESQNVQDEVAYAIDRQKKIIPVKIKDCETPFRLLRFQFIDFAKDYDTAFNRLMLALDQKQKTIKPFISQTKKKQNRILSVTGIITVLVFIIIIIFSLDRTQSKKSIMSNKEAVAQLFKNVTTDLNIYYLAPDSSKEAGISWLRLQKNYQADFALYTDSSISKTYDTLRKMCYAYTTIYNCKEKCLTIVRDMNVLANMAVKIKDTFYISLNSYESDSSGIYLWATRFEKNINEFRQFYNPVVMDDLRLNYYPAFKELFALIKELEPFRWYFNARFYTMAEDALYKIKEKKITNYPIKIFPRSAHDSIYACYNKLNSFTETAFYFECKERFEKKVLEFIKQ